MPMKTRNCAYAGKAPEPAQASRRFSDWHDREITAGSEWANQISEHLESAQIILLLISPDFLASDYCHDVEMTRAMERHNNKEARVIPIILRPVDWEGAPFSKLQCLPRNAEPVNPCKNEDSD